MVDKFRDPMLTPREVARHLVIPPTTVYHWLSEKANGAPLVHHVAPEKRGRPSVPFVAVVEAYVLRSLRSLGLSMPKIKDAAAEVRRVIDSPYALATHKITTDGVDVFVHYADDDLARAGDNQRPFRDVIEGYLRYIEWDVEDGFASSLRLRQYPDVAPVVLDPRFGWGAPIVRSAKVPVKTVVDLWRAGESFTDVAYEYGLTTEQVEAICRVYDGAA
ncbi:uncharacterized protein (DUF433 family) [Actinokineospora baliensis]|uniref:DUF433 domain-containing protein n=1 Tax=Actinokineospora baliensis TaxID=547056 RepID=UPI00195A8908|nr:DUF433 domain-containing protein [Actinokineospora baliensis]MBM7769943.1 uncharacterized protein (DUF433 family) [Actinokineospora baliensis]